MLAGDTFEGDIVQLMDGDEIHGLLAEVTHSEGYGVVSVQLIDSGAAWQLKRDYWVEPVNPVRGPAQQGLDL